MNPEQRAARGVPRASASPRQEGRDARAAVAAAAGHADAPPPPPRPRVGLRAGEATPLGWRPGAARGARALRPQPAPRGGPGWRVRAGGECADARPGPVRLSTGAGTQPCFSDGVVQFLLSPTTRSSSSAPPSSTSSGVSPSRGPGSRPGGVGPADGLRRRSRPRPRDSRRDSDADRWRYVLRALTPSCRSRLRALGVAAPSVGPEPPSLRPRERLAPDKPLHRGRVTGLSPGGRHGGTLCDEPC